MSFRAACPHCSVMSAFDDRFEGQHGQCLKCGKRFLIVRDAEDQNGSSPSSGATIATAGAGSTGKPAAVVERHFPVINFLTDICSMIAAFFAIVGVVAVGVTANEEQYLIATLIFFGCGTYCLLFLLAGEVMKLGLAIEENTRHIANSSR